MSDTTIRSITARKGMRGAVNKWSFSGVEAQDHIDKYMEEVRMTKTDLENYESNVSAFAAAAEASAKESAENATASDTSAKAAAGSATAAATSESNAASSAKAAAASAEESAKAADGVEEYATLSKSYAVGGTGTRDGEDEDNAKRYAEESMKYANAAENSASTAAEYANTSYALEAKSYAVGGTGTREGEDTDNAKWYYEHIAGTDVGDLAELEKLIESNLNSINHDQKTYPAFVADRLANVTDLNTCITNGIYQFTASASNNPVNAIGMVLALNSTGSGETGYIAQYAWAGSDAHTVYARDDHSGTWGAWKKVGADGVKNIAISGKTITVTMGDGTTKTLTTQDTVYTLPNATSSTLGGVKVGSNITVSSGTISVTKSNVTSALGYTPPTTNTTYTTATTSAAGLMSASDKSKLDGIASGANAYTLPAATSSVLGGVKTGSNITNSSGTISLTKANVTSALGYTPPTTNTTYGVATSSANGLMSSTDKAHHDAMYTEVYKRPNTRKLSTQTLTAEGGTLTWTDSCITDTSLIDVYASIPNIAPSAITQSGTTVTVTFSAQDEAFSVALVVM